MMSLHLVLLGSLMNRRSLPERLRWESGAVVSKASARYLQYLLKTNSEIITTVLLMQKKKKMCFYSNMKSCVSSVESRAVTSGLYRKNQGRVVQGIRL